MRAPTAIVTSVVAAVTVFAAWQHGSQPSSGGLPGVSVIADPAAQGAAGSGQSGGSAKSGSSKSSHSGSSKSRSSKSGSSKSGSSKSGSSKSGSSKSGSSKSSSSQSSTRQTVRGALVSTPYGNVQVEVVLVGKRITDVQALHLTDANGHSRAISAGAAPTLRREALTAQSATIDTVSGATYTSEGYKTSLQAALDQAHV